MSSTLLHARCSGNESGKRDTEGERARVKRQSELSKVSENKVKENEKRVESDRECVRERERE